MLLKLFSQQPRRQEPFSKRLVLAELRSTLSAQFGNADGLDNKLKQLLNSASLILSIVTTLQITTGVNRIGWLYLVGLSIAFVLYAILIIVIMRALRPATYQAPIPPDWDGIANNYFGKDEESTLDLLISTYIDALDKNDAPLIYKSRMVQVASWLLVSIVITLLGMGIFGLGHTIILPGLYVSPQATPVP